MYINLKQFGCIFALMFILTLAISPLPVFAHGGGGGGGGGEGGGGGGGSGGGLPGLGGGNNPVANPWTPSQLSNIFSSLTPSQKANLVSVYSGSTVSKRQLLNSWSIMHERNRRDVHFTASVIEKMENTLEVLDKAGQHSQTALSFVPGVGFVTSTGLDVMRSGADAYKDGKSAKDIAVKAVSTGITAGLMNKFSAASTTLSRLTKSGSSKISAAAKKTYSKLGSLLSRLTGYAKDKAVGDATQAAVEKGLDAVVSTKSMPNTFSPPTYTPTSSYGMHK